MSSGGKFTSLSGGRDFCWVYFDGNHGLPQCVVVEITDLMKLNTNCCIGMMSVMQCVL